MMKASIIIGLGWGDEGKGITTDFLCAKATDPIVVRFSGGQQCGHTVIIKDRKHVHSSYGSGTLRGVPSYFSEHCTIYLNTLAVERTELRNKGVEPQLTLHPLTKLTTPYDVAYNRLTEKRNGHGSCGLGVAATMKRNAMNYKFVAADLTHPGLAIQKLKKVCEYYDKLVPPEDKAEFQEIVKDSLLKFVKLMTVKLFSIDGYSALRGYSDIIFEGSQGILLDMDHGIFPNVTYAHTTCKNAIEICDKLMIRTTEREVFYVTRCYQTRHGNGWMSNHMKVELTNNTEEINVTNEWQGTLRVAEIDYKLLDYSLDIDSIYFTGFRRNLVITCLDQRPGFEFDYDALSTKFSSVYNSTSPKTNLFRMYHGIGSEKPTLVNSDED